jgi:hypothetical protein
MSGFLISRRIGPVVVALLGFALASCAGSDRSTAPGAISADQMTMQGMADNPNSAAGDAKGVIHGWLNGETVSLRYTRSYFCAEPPTSAVSTHCEIGADATVAPRSGPIPVMYALSPAGFQPDPSTVHCSGASVCLNHPHALDASRLGLPDSVAHPAHSHIITDTQAGWHKTINIRVPTLAAWNMIAEAKTLAKVRELQAAGLVGPDIPTNVYFFFEVQQPEAP